MKDEDEKIFKFIMEREGRFSKDHAGETVWGVSLRWLKTIGDAGDADRDGDVDAKDVMMIDQEKAWGMFEHFIFKSIRVDAMPGKLRMACMDTAVNVGGPQCIKLLQRAANWFDANLIIDGKCGKKTISAVKKIGETALVAMLLFERLRFYANLAALNKEKYGAYYKGWVNRVMMLYKLILEL